MAWFMGSWSTGPGADLTRMTAWLARRSSPLEGPERNRPSDAPGPNFRSDGRRADSSSMTRRSAAQSSALRAWFPIVTVGLVGLIGAIAGTWTSASGDLASAVVYGRDIHWAATGPLGTPPPGGPFAEGPCFQNGSCFVYARNRVIHVIRPSQGVTEVAATRASTLVPGNLSCDPTGACWSLGRSSVGKGYLDQSMDGGVTWHESVGIGLTRPAREVSLSCANLMTCVNASWAPRGGVEYAFTRNGGRNWVSRSIPGYSGVDGIRCSANQICFLYLVSHGDSSSLFRSENGGRSWVIDELSIEHPSGLPVCTSVTRCWAWGYPMVPDDNGPALFISGDGGHTWSPVDVPQQTFVFLSVPWCSTDQRCWSIGFDNQGLLPALIDTGDGGRHWEVHAIRGAGPKAFDLVACPTAASCIGMSQSTDFATFPRSWVLSASSRG